MTDSLCSPEKTSWRRISHAPDLHTGDLVSNEDSEDASHASTQGVARHNDLIILLTRRREDQGKEEEGHRRTAKKRERRITRDIAEGKKFPFRKKHIKVIERHCRRRKSASEKWKNNRK